MSKLKGFTTSLRPTTSTTTRTSTAGALANATTAAANKGAMSKQTVVIDVNSTREQKKKRVALENISTNTSNLTNASLAAQNPTKEVTKKTRYGSQDHAPHQEIKKTESTLTNKRSTLTKEVSKENILPNKKPTTLHEPPKQKKALSIQAVDNKHLGVKAHQSKADQGGAGVLGKSVSVNSGLNNMKKEKLEVKENKHEVVDKMERQLAVTTISSSSSTTSICSELSSQSLSNIDFSEAIKLEADRIEGWLDIDAEDLDEFSCSDYVSYIFKYYREREDKFLIEDYIKQQPFINKQMRVLLVDWMVEVQQQLEFNHEVLYLSVKLLDLYLNKRKIEKEKLQLLGGAAMFIACKFEERMPPIIDDFIYVSDSAYDRKELIKMEIDILKTIKFDIGIPLSYTFLRRYSKCIKADMRFLTLARYILELSLQDYSFSYVKDSQKACAALYLAMKMAVNYEKSLKQLADPSSITNTAQQMSISTSNLTSTEWNATLIHYTGSFLSDFIHLIPLMNNLLKTAVVSKYKTIYKKYSHQVFYEVAQIPTLSDTDIQQLEQLAKTQPGC